MSPDQAAGMRERKKRATCNAIELAGVTLALTKGHADVSVAEICERADVSRSTFFNYMPTREAAIFGAPLRLAPAPEVAGVLELSRDVPLTTALLRVVFVSVGHAWVNPDVAAARIRLGKEQPETEVLVAAPLTALFAELTHFLTGWLNENHERRVSPAISAEREARYLVMLAGAGFHSAISEVTGDGDMELSERAFEAAIDEVVGVGVGRRAQ